MSESERPERIICPNCGQLTIIGEYCMFCGAELPKKIEETPKKVEEKIEIEKPLIEEEAKEEETPTMLPPLIPTEAVPLEEVDVQKLIDQLASIHNWRLKLVDIFLNNEARADIFLELFNEYQTKLEKLEEKRIKELKNVEEELKNLTMKLDELKIRHEVGEIRDKDYITMKLELDREISRLKPKKSILQNPFKVKLADIPQFEATLVEKIEKFQKDAPALGLEKQKMNKILKELSETLENVRSLMEEYRKIKRQMEKVEIKYKIGEIKEEEYKSQKQKFERELGM
ncbi:MAG: hypothetical protein QXV60_02380 [Nitrososphaerota archaeon]